MTYPTIADAKAAMARAAEVMPGHVPAWYHAWTLRAAWYIQHGGDMTGCPVKLPSEDRP